MCNVYTKKKKMVGKKVVRRGEEVGKKEKEMTGWRDDGTAAAAGDYNNKEDSH